MWSCLAAPSTPEEQRKCRRVCDLPLGLPSSIFTLKNKTMELLVRHMIWPTIISCISKGCFGKKQRQGSASLSWLYLETLDSSFDPSLSALFLVSLPLFSLVFSISLEASWQYTIHFPRRFIFKLKPHFWKLFTDRTQKHIWHFPVCRPHQLVALGYLALSISTCFLV